MPGSPIAFVALWCLIAAICSWLHVSRIARVSLHVGSTAHGRLPLPLPCTSPPPPTLGCGEEGTSLARLLLHYLTLPTIHALRHLHHYAHDASTQKESGRKSLRYRNESCARRSRWAPRHQILAWPFCSRMLRKAIARTESRPFRLPPRGCDAH